jgi:sphingolipid 4-desaturase/C4-monooxygenase
VGRRLVKSTVNSSAEDFLFSDQREPHALRAREILRSHAEIRGLAGRNPWSVLLVIGIVLTQTALAAVLGHAPLGRQRPAAASPSVAA